MKNKFCDFISGIIMTFRLLKNLTGKKANILLVQAAAYIFITCYQALFQPYILVQIYAALETNEVMRLFTVCAISGGVVLLFFILSYINNVYLDVYSFRLKLLSSQNACQRLFILPYDKINNRFKEDELLNRIDTATLNFVTVIMSVGLIISNTISIMVLFNMFSTYSYILIVITILLSIWGFLVGHIEIKLCKKYENNRQKLEDDAGGLLYNSIHEIEFSEMFACDDYLYRNYAAVRKNIWNTKWEQEKTSMIATSLTDIFLSALRSLLSMVLFPMYRNNIFTSNQIASSFSIYDQLCNSVNSYKRPFVDINTQLINIRRLNEIMEICSEKVSVEKMGECLIKANNLYYSIDGKVILNDISMHINKGEKIALIGRNGCGKSTLLRVIAGIYHAETGVLKYNAEVLKIVRDISYIPASSMLYDSTINTNILMNGDNDILRVLSLAELHSEEILLDKPTSQLSGGQAQRVNIARGLINNTPLLLADEPVSSLSQSQGETVIKNIINESDTAIIVTHNPAHLRFFSRIILMENGRMVASGNLDEIATHPAYLRWDSVK